MVLWWREPLESIPEMLCLSPVDGSTQLRWQAVRVIDKHGVRQCGDLHESELWEERDKHMPHRCFLMQLIFYSDETGLDHSNQYKGYPIYMTIGHLTKDARKCQWA